MNIKVSRLNQHPADEPTGFAVGFTCECVNGRSFYTDTHVSFDDASSDDEAVTVALDRLGESIQSRCDGLEAKSSLLGVDVTDQLSAPVVDDDDE